MKCETCSDSHGRAMFVCWKCKQVVPEQMSGETCKYCRFWKHLPDHLKGQYGQCQRPGAEKFIVEGKPDNWFCTFVESWCEHFEACDPDETGRKALAEDEVKVGETVYTDHDRLCPECGKLMVHEGGGTYVCKPCDISMDSVDFENREEGVTSKACPECNKPLRFMVEYSEEVHYECTGCRSYIVVNTSGGTPTEKVSREEYDKLMDRSQAAIGVLKELIAGMIQDAREY